MRFSFDLVLSSCTAHLEYTICLQLYEYNRVSLCYVLYPRCLSFECCGPPLPTSHPLSVGQGNLFHILFTLSSKQWRCSPLSRSWLPTTQVLYSIFTYQYTMHVGKLHHIKEVRLCFQHTKKLCSCFCKSITYRSYALYALNLMFCIMLLFSKCV